MALTSQRAVSLRLLAHHRVLGFAPTAGGPRALLHAAIGLIELRAPPGRLHTRSRGAPGAMVARAWITGFTGRGRSIAHGHAARLLAGPPAGDGRAALTAADAGAQVPRPGAGRLGQLAILRIAELRTIQGSVGTGAATPVTAGDVAVIRHAKAAQLVDAGGRGLRAQRVTHALAAYRRTSATAALQRQAPLTAAIRCSQRVAAGLGHALARPVGGR